MLKLKTGLFLPFNIPEKTGMYDWNIPRPGFAWGYNKQGFSVR
jgi:hypothetical protein